MRFGGRRFQRIIWDGHAVLGATISIALFVMFYAGAFALYRGELHAWADPHLRGEVDPANVSVVSTLLLEQPPDRGTDVTVVHPLGDRPYFFVRYVHAGEHISLRVGASTVSVQAPA